MILGPGIVSRVGIRNSDGTDNSLDVGGTIGQKVHVVGILDLNVEGVVAAGESLAGRFPNTIGWKDGSGNNQFVSAATPLPVDIAAGDIVDVSSLATTANQTNGNQRTKIYNSDGTDNSATYTSVIAQKVHIVGMGDIYARGIQAQGSTLSGVQPVFVGTENPSGNSKGLQSDTGGNLYVNSVNHQTRSDVFTGTGNGTTVTSTTVPVKYFSLQVVKSGAVTVWDIRLEGSVDGTNFTTILTHTNTTGDLVVLAATTPFPCRYFRSRCVTITGGTNLTATILGMN